MGMFDLCDRLNWEQAARLLGVGRSTFFKLVQDGQIKGYGCKGCRFYLKSELADYLKRTAADKE